MHNKPEKHEREMKAYLERLRRSTHHSENEEDASTMDDFQDTGDFPMDFAEELYGDHDDDPDMPKGDNDSTTSDKYDLSYESEGDSNDEIERDDDETTEIRRDDYYPWPSKDVV